jgi:hypothetical protein
MAVDIKEQFCYHIAFKVIENFSEDKLFSNNKFYDLFRLTSYGGGAGERG